MELDSTALNNIESNEDAFPKSVGGNATQSPIASEEQAIPNTNDTSYVSAHRNVENASDPMTQTLSEQNPSNTAASATARPRASSLWPSGDDDVTALQLLRTMEDLELQKKLAEQHGKRSLITARQVAQQVFDHRSSNAFREEDGWIHSKAQSRAAGRNEIGLIAEFPQPVLRANPRPPSQDKTYWMPGPDNIFIMCKLCIGLIIWNDYNAKLIKAFTTKSGTDPDHLRTNGDLGYYTQLIRVPEENGVPEEDGVTDVVLFETSGHPDIDWNIRGPRLMEDIASYLHPHGKPYRIVGGLKINGYDEDALRRMWRKTAEMAVADTRAAFRARRRDFDPYWQYRNSARSNIDDETVAEEVCFVVALLGFSFSLT